MEHALGHTHASFSRNWPINGHSNCRCSRGWNGMYSLAVFRGLHPGRKFFKYVDLNGGIKPYLLSSVINNLGSETYIDYTSVWFGSTQRKTMAHVSPFPSPSSLSGRINRSRGENV